MVDEARLEDAGSGLAPASGGWFVVNAGEAAWIVNEAFGACCVFEANEPVVRKRPDLQTILFPDLGITLSVIWPGQSSGLYHAESKQESFLVLSGECMLLIEETERPLRAWDFVYCPPGINHAFVGAGDDPCAILMVGARGEDKRISYPRSELALRAGAGVERATKSAREAYADRPHWRPERPDGWSQLPWADPRCA
jgi:uncharacterized cupin superfamily protein